MLAPGKLHRGEAMARKPADEVQLKLRFAERLRAQIEKSAEKNQRSMNAEIIDRLVRSYVNEYIELSMAETAKRFMDIINNRLKGIEEMIDKRLPPVQPGEGSKPD